ncbi:MAG: LmbE family protein [Chlamydiae bacterium]|nr:MAG: LmbE family protein [Chlamydiota bacterium]
MICKVFAIAAHADDIEFRMAGTLILLAKAGCEIHYMNIANGSCGSAEHDAETIAAIRLEESKNAANKINAVFHSPLVNDIEIFYEKNLLAKIGSVMRSVAPDILLVDGPMDYMEDHTISSRLAVTAAFTRAMRNFPVDPPKEPVFNQVTVYHAQPHGNRDLLNRFVFPDFLINIDSVIKEKSDMLNEHKSQKEWLEKSQGFDVYLNTMKNFSRELGNLSAKCEFAEGWRYHNPLGLCNTDSNPLRDILQSKFNEVPSGLG